MPEDPKVEQPAGGPTPAFNVEELRKVIGEEVSQRLATVSKDQPSEMIESDPTVTPKATENPLRAVLEPILGPDLQRLNLGVEGATDAAIFYSTQKDAAKHKDEIEKMFKGLMQQGIPFTREALLAYIRGKPENIEAEVKARMEAEAKALEDAKMAETMGPGFRPTGGPVKDAHDATDDELAKALQNVSF